MCWCFFVAVYAVTKSDAACARRDFPSDGVASMIVIRMSCLLDPQLDSLPSGVPTTTVVGSTGMLEDDEGISPVSDATVATNMRIA